MTRIDFYLLSGIDAAQRYVLICKLAEKAILQRQKVFIYSQSNEELDQLDNLLWDFKAMSFIPHIRQLSSEISTHTTDAPVVLSSVEPDVDRTVLINLHSSVPSFFSRFHRALEIIDENPEVQAPGRERYRFYQQRGYPLRHHKM